MVHGGTEGDKARGSRTPGGAREAMIQGKGEGMDSGRKAAERMQAWLDDNDSKKRATANKASQERTAGDEGSRRSALLGSPKP